jgi:hypothetical protein
MEIGTKIQFTDKTGELLKGEVTAVGFDGNPNILTALCYKPSWEMEVSCLVPKKAVTIV